MLRLYNLFVSICDVCVLYIFVYIFVYVNQ